MKRREIEARKTHLRLAYLATVERHGDDVLGRARPSSGRECEQQGAAARAAFAHLSALGLAGIYPAWITNSDVA